MDHRIIGYRLIVRLILIFSFGLIGCVSMTPDYQRPEVGTPVPEQYQNAAAVEDGLTVDDRWWQDFGDPELNRVVETAVQNNWDIKQAAARILELHAIYYRAAGRRYPQVDIDASVDRRQLRGTSGTAGDRRITTYEISAPAFYELDLWGRLASAEKATWNDILQAEDNRKTVAQTVVADAIRLYLEIEAIERQLQIARQSVDNFRLSADFIAIRYNRGLVSILDLRQARRVLAQAQARIPQIEQDLGATQQQLSILLGQYPQIEPARQQPEDYYKQLTPIPAGLPSDLLLRRPDIRAAEARLIALNERIGEAIAARFPTITLTGEYGYASDDLSKLIKPDNAFWNLSAGLLHPLFDAGQLKADQKAAEARYQQQMAEYAQVVLTAFGEVEEALLTREKQLVRRQRLLKFAEEARATQRVAQNRYIRGLAAYLDVLDAQQTRFQAEENIVEVDLAILVNRVALHRAIGGGWAAPEAIPTEKYFNLINY